MTENLLNSSSPEKQEAVLDFQRNIGRVGVEADRVQRELDQLRQEKEQDEQGRKEMLAEKRAELQQRIEQGLEERNKQVDGLSGKELMGILAVYLKDDEKKGLTYDEILEKAGGDEMADILKARRDNEYAADLKREYRNERDRTRREFNKTAKPRDNRISELEGEAGELGGLMQRMEQHEVDRKDIEEGMRGLAGLSGSDLSEKMREYADKNDQYDAEEVALKEKMEKFNEKYSDKGGEERGDASPEDIEKKIEDIDKEIEIYNKLGDEEAKERDELEIQLKEQEEMEAQLKEQEELEKELRRLEEEGEGSRGDEGETGEILLDDEDGGKVNNDSSGDNGRVEYVLGITSKRREAERTAGKLAEKDLEEYLAKGNFLKKLGKGIVWGNLLRESWLRRRTRERLEEISQKQKGEQIDLDDEMWQTTADNEMMRFVDVAIGKAGEEMLQDKLGEEQDVYGVEMEEDENGERREVVYKYMNGGKEKEKLDDQNSKEVMATLGTRRAMIEFARSDGSDDAKRKFRETVGEYQKSLYGKKDADWIVDNFEKMADEFRTPYQEALEHGRSVENYENGFRLARMNIYEGGITERKLGLIGRITEKIVNSPIPRTLGAETVGVLFAGALGVGGGLVAPAVASAKIAGVVAAGATLPVYAPVMIGAGLTGFVIAGGKAVMQSEINRSLQHERRGVGEELGDTRKERKLARTLYNTVPAIELASGLEEAIKSEDKDKIVEAYGRAKGLWDAGQENKVDLISFSSGNSEVIGSERYQLVSTMADARRKLQDEYGVDFADIDNVVARAVDGVKEDFDIERTEKDDVFRKLRNKEGITKGIISGAISAVLAGGFSWVGNKIALDYIGQSTETTGLTEAQANAMQADQGGTITQSGSKILETVKSVKQQIGEKIPNFKDILHYLDNGTSKVAEESELAMSSVDFSYPIEALNAAGKELMSNGGELVYVVQDASENAAQYAANVVDGVVSPASSVISGLAETSRSFSLMIKDGITGELYSVAGISGNGTLGSLPVEETVEQVVQTTIPLFTHISERVLTVAQQNIINGFSSAAGAFVGGAATRRSTLTHGRKGAVSEPRPSSESGGESEGEFEGEGGGGDGGVDGGEIPVSTSESEQSSGSSESGGETGPIDENPVFTKITADSESVNIDREVFIDRPYLLPLIEVWNSIPEEIRRMEMSNEDNFEEEEELLNRAAKDEDEKNKWLDAMNKLWQEGLVA